MNHHFNIKNLVATLIAIVLFASGFALWFVHEQTQMTSLHETDSSQR